MPSQEVLKSDMRAQVRACLAAEMWGPCPACGDTVDPGGNPYFSIGGNEMPDGSDCPDCHGTGKQFLLRKACINAHDGPYWCVANQCAVCSPGDGSSGLGYLFDDSPDALWDAVRALADSWAVGEWAWSGFIHVNLWKDQLCIGMVANDDQITDAQAAIELAVARALGWKRG